MSKKETSQERDQLDVLIEQYAKQWMTIPGVEAVGISMSHQHPEIVVYASVRTEHLVQQLPSCVEGIPVRISDTDSFRSKPTS